MPQASLKVRMAGVVTLALVPACTGTLGSADNGSGDPGNGGDGAGSGGSNGGKGGSNGSRAGAGGDTPTEPTAARPTFSCDQKAVPASVPLRRLTNIQYRNTLRDVLTLTLGDPAAAMAALSEVSKELDSIPADQRQIQPLDPHGSYRRLDQNIQQVQVTGVHNVAVKLGAALTSTARLAKVVGACAATANDDACLTNFIKSFGARTFRRPLADDEVAFYKMFYADPTGGQAARYADVITGLLEAPQFIFLVEHGTDAVSGQSNVYKLSAYELASRLSYHYWNTMPDAALLADAASGKLLTTAGYADAVARLWKDPRAQGAMDEFFQDYFKLDDLPPLDRFNNSATFKSFAGKNLPTTALRPAVFEDALGLARQYVFSKPGTLNDLFTTNLSFARSDELAAIYGIGAWKTGDPPAFPDGKRPGFLTRAFAVMTGGTTTRPIMKGVYIRRNVLCDQIPPPPANAATTVPVISGMMNTREVVEEITKGGVCAGCHTQMINPIGGVTENFDGLGRERTTETVFDLGASSLTQVKVLGTPKIDTRSTPRVNFSDTTEVTSARELEDLILASGKAHACFARHYFRFTFQRWEDEDADGCALERLRKGLVDNGSLPETLRDIALDQSFQTRVFAP